jgi:CheY-like chemotaxis protein
MHGTAIWHALEHQGKNVINLQQ